MVSPIKIKNIIIEIFCKNFFLLFIIIIIILAIYNALILGFSWDESFHHINGLVRFNYLISLGEFKNFNYFNNKYYPGLFDTISFSISRFIEITNKDFYNNYISEIKHFINLSFSILSLYGLFLLVCTFFNKDTALLSVLFTLLNTFFFGHMSTNPKDIIIFFSLIWFCYFFWKYLSNNKEKYLNLFLLSFFAGFGCGVRITFLALLLPVFLIGLIYFFKKSNNFLVSIKVFFTHLILSLMVIIFLVIITWPHILTNSFVLIIDTIKSSINWSAGPRLGLINGVFYETQNTPNLYFFEMIKYKFPFFFTFLYMFSYLFFFFDKNFFVKKIEYFSIKFLILNVLIFFPIFISVIFSVKIYDYLRLFIFIIPFLSILASLSFYYFLKNYYYSYNKIFITIGFLLFSVFFYRFIVLNPYQYTYVNFYYPKLKNSLYKFEHDYWGISFRELISKIKFNYSSDEISKMKISICGGDVNSVIFYLKKYLNISRIYNNNESTHVIMTNRASFNPNDKTTCFLRYQGEDILSVHRDSLLLSTLRTIKH